MQLIMLGTGHATVTECYNTCFLLQDEDLQENFLVDGGGGNAILWQLKKAKIDCNSIHQMFVTHKHMDHIMGILWLIRIICQNMRNGTYEGDAYVYAHEEVVGMISSICRMLLMECQAVYLGDRVHLIAVADGECRMILGKKVTFFDIHSDKAKQFGFSMELTEGERLTCCGDEPYHECNEVYVKESKWLMHEAFCLSSQTDIFRPYEKNHSTVKDACETAERLNVDHLILYHTEDRNIKERRELYLAEGRKYYHGKLYVPEDLEKIIL